VAHQEVTSSVTNILPGSRAASIIINWEWGGGGEDKIMCTIILHDIAKSFYCISPWEKLLAFSKHSGESPPMTSMQRL